MSFSCTEEREKMDIVEYSKWVIVDFLLLIKQMKNDEFS